MAVNIKFICSYKCLIDRNMLGAITAGLGLATSVGGSIWGAIESSKAGQKTRDLITQQKDENKKWYEQQMNEDYLQRSDAQNVLRKQRELLNEQYRRARATNLVAGGTDESLAMQQQAANETMGETMASIAANASAHKDNVDAQYRELDSALDQQMAQSYGQQSQNIASAAGQLTQAGASMMSAGMQASDLNLAKKNKSTGEGSGEVNKDDDKSKITQSNT